MGWLNDRKALHHHLHRLYRRDFVYWVIIEGIDEFPRGLYVEMELTDLDPKDPIVSLLNAHPPTFPQR